MTYTSTELIVDFENYDIEVYNGVSENFVNQGDTLFTSTITGAVPRQTFVNVNEQGFTDLAGNEGGPVDEFTIDIFTGTFETQAIKRVNVYPNPATGFIQIGSVEAINRIGLFHIDGTIIKTYIFAQGKAIVKLDVSGLSSGVYILKVLMDTKISTTKIVKR
ncbi:MAG: hypothetical protein B6D64_04620 [Bacteroidetes bacterium 4484_276]|nr:MAG: hypothetical protein B6D64_04620 [Bacteroidetes bacterium 4484_276]OYT12626.1 MAG: hypothetical protein B6I19_09365 [Bacteroidetes bacterium 4572_114]